MGRKYQKQKSTSNVVFTEELDEFGPLNASDAALRRKIEMIIKIQIENRNEAKYRTLIVLDINY